MNNFGLSILLFLPSPRLWGKTAGPIKIIGATIYVDWVSTSKFCTVLGGEGHAQDHPAPPGNAFGRSRMWVAH